MNEKSIIEKPVTAPYICNMIGVSRPALHKWSKAGIVRSHKIGGKLFYFESEVMEDLKKC
ncbi:MAG: helix-turn-helix domain-containing protein [Bacteroidales bacterium]|nr:helix-turn-helix domain-containing protein [Bacteroidales bacterium]